MLIEHILNKNKFTLIVSIKLSSAILEKILIVRKSFNLIIF